MLVTLLLVAYYVHYIAEVSWLCGLSSAVFFHKFSCLVYMWPVILLLLDLTSLSMKFSALFPLDLVNILTCNDKLKNWALLCNHYCKLFVSHWCTEWILLCTSVAFLLIMIFFSSCVTVCVCVCVSLKKYMHLELEVQVAFIDSLCDIVLQFLLQIEYDPRLINFRQLLEVFWSSHDSRQVFGQGPDVGNQYRYNCLYSSVVYVKSRSHSVDYFLSTGLLSSLMEVKNPD